MSDRPTESSQSARAAAGTESQERKPRDPLGNERYERPTAASGSSAPSPSMQRLQQSSAPGRFELPAIPQAPNFSGSNFMPSPSRLAGVASILNPSTTEEPGSNRRRKAAEFDSPSAAAATLPPLTNSAQPSNANVGRPGGPSAGSFPASAERQPRRILTPISPALHRTASLSQINQPTTTLGAQQTPFLSSQRNVPRQPHGFSALGPTPSAEAARRAGSGLTRATRATSASVSPTTSYSSYSQAEQTSPAAQYGPLSSGADQSNYTGSNAAYGGAEASGAMSQDRQMPMGIPISSSGGPNVYQMMTLETTSGTVQLPVDVQAASRVADEKRRRNAGASARFRQRRKEKEKEASTTIGRLEQQVKELSEDADYYKRERDYLASVVLAFPGGDRHFPRPPSPRRRRSSNPLAGHNVQTGVTYAEPQSPDQGRNVRRRTSTISLPPPTLHPGAAAPGGPFAAGYVQPQYGTPMAPPQQVLQPAQGPLPSPMARPLLPSASALPPAHQHPSSGPPQLMQAPPQTGPWNPYAADRRPPGPPQDGR